MVKFQVALLNTCSHLTNEEVQRVAAALQVQVSEHFAPVWGIDADITFYPSQAPPPDAWQLVILDDHHKAAVLGFHELTERGLPLGKVFAGRDISLGRSWSSTASHELIEMLVNPDVNMVVLTEVSKNGQLCVYEACDACQGDANGYRIGDVLVSNFVYPSWFKHFCQPGTKFDHCGKIQRPFQVLPGGHIAVLEAAAGEGWRQYFSETENAGVFQIPDVDTRLARGSKPRLEWKRSERSHFDPKLHYGHLKHYPGTPAGAVSLKE